MTKLTSIMNASCLVIMLLVLLKLAGLVVKQFLLRLYKFIRCELKLVLLSAISTHAVLVEGHLNVLVDHAELVLEWLSEPGRERRRSTFFDRW